MATKEIITLSSDEESGCINEPQLIQNKPYNNSGRNFHKQTSLLRKSHIYTPTSKKDANLNSSKSIQASIQKNFHQIYHKLKTKSKKDEIFIINEKSNKGKCSFGNSPEVVDLEECNNATEVIINSDNVKPNIQLNAVENHSEIKLIESNDNGLAKTQQGLDVKQLAHPNNYVHVISFNDVTMPNSTVETEMKGDKDGPEIPEFFNKFVEVCSSLEKNTTDRARLIKKLQKRCKRADPKYVKSQEFRTLIYESKEKINKNNLYLIAKEITDELSLRKKLEIENAESNEEVTNDKGQVISEDEKKNKKKTKIINKIVKKLDKLGKKIRELEEAEVDLSDEEDSSYILVQRYRERFCQIYKKLCEVTNESSDANRVYCRKICFSGSKYPAINQCLEKWLNKTRRFPDFNDIVKLLESQSSSLGLPSNKESIRATATEIFQEVGKMLQRRRKHDLWDSLCGFLNDDKDPALADPDLDRVLRKNFDTRVKKEQEIFRHYAELQEKERLEPEEVPEEEANLSPNESGNEDEEEIEGIEKSLNERLDVTIEKEHNLKESDYNWEGGEKNMTEEVESLPQSYNLPTGVKETETPTQVKESKNNYKNCKSIKYRGENRSKSTEDSSSSKNGFEETDEKERREENFKENLDGKAMETKEEEAENKVDTSSEEGVLSDKENSEVDIVSVESNEMETESLDLDKFDFSKIPIVKLMRLPDDLDLSNISVSGNAWLSSKSEKRGLDSEENAPASVKKKKTDSPVFDIDFKNDVEEVFEVHRCEIEHEYIDEIINFQDDVSEKRKHWDKGKIFRDLTNVGRLMELNGKKRKSGYFSHSIYHPGFPEFPKFSWKKRFRLNYKFVGMKDQKCALSQDDKESKSVGGDGKDSDGKGVENNSESGGDDGSNFFIGGGSGSEKDNDENDENRGGEKTKDFSDDSKHDEDEEEEEETDDEMDGLDRKKPEEEILLDDSFNCSTDDHISSFNDSNTTLEIIPDRISNTENEEEIEGNKVEDTSESNINTKRDENCENFVENKAGEPKGNVEDESMSPMNSRADGSELSYEESQEPEELDTQMDIDKVDVYQIEGESNESRTEEGINDVEEREEDAEVGEEVEKEEDAEVGEEVEKEEDAEAGEEVEKEEDAEAGEEVEKEEDAEAGEEVEKEEDAEAGEEVEKEEDAEAGEEVEKEEDAEAGEKEKEEDVESLGIIEQEESVEIREEEMKFDGAETGEEQVMEENTESGRGQQVEVLDVDSTDKQNEEDIAEIVEEKGQDEDVETGGQLGTGMDMVSVEQQEQEENSETVGAQVKEEERETNEERDAELSSSSSSKKEKPLIRLRNLAEMEARVDSRMVRRIEPRIEPRIDMRLEPRFGLRMESMVEQRIVPRMEPRIEQRVGQRLEARFGLRMEPMMEPRPEPRIEQRVVPRIEQRVVPRVEPRVEQRLEARFGLRMEPMIEPRPELRIEQRLEARFGLRVEPRVEQRVERRSGLRIEQRVEPRFEQRAGLRLEPRGGLRLEPRGGLRLEPRAGLRLEPRGGLRLEPRLEPRPGLRAELRTGLGVEQRVETRVEQRFERSPLGCKNKRENVVKREFNQVNQGNQINQSNQNIQTMQTMQTTQSIQTNQTNQRKLSAREESTYHGNQDSEIEFLGQKIGKRKKTTRSPTDEERVKKFLMHSPSSISIIPPKKLSLSKPPSQAALQALETLKGLKGISATRVRSKESSKVEEDVVVIGESFTRPQTARKSTGSSKRRNDLPVISSVHSIQSPSSATGSPKLLGFQGNLSGFQGPSQSTTTTTAVLAAAPSTNNRMKNGPPGQLTANDSSSIRISSVWGSLPQTTVYSRSVSTPGNSESPLPGCSFQKDSISGGGGEPTAKKKKKPVEFVVLE